MWLGKEEISIYYNGSKWSNLWHFIYIENEKIVATVRRIKYSDNKYIYKARIMPHQTPITDEDPDVLKLKCMIKMGKEI